MQDTTRAERARAKSFILHDMSELDYAQRQQLKKAVIARLLISQNNMDWLIGSMIEGDMLKLKFRKFIASSARGAFIPGGDTIYINENYFLNEYGDLFTSRAAMVDMTSTVIHEGVHFLGGGEIAAHLAQGLYLGIQLKKNKELALNPMSHLIAENAANSSLLPLTRTVFSKGYGTASKPLTVEHLQPLHEIVKDLGGFENLLGVKETSLSQLRHSVPMALPL